VSSKKGNRISPAKPSASSRKRKRRSTANTATAVWFWRRELGMENIKENKIKLAFGLPWLILFIENSVLKGRYVAEANNQGRLICK
jgi:hypothetical protein